MEKHTWTYRIKSERLFYMRDTRKNAIVGNCILWWRDGKSGYTCDINNAHIFTEKEAMNQHKSRETDVPYPKDYIDSITKKHIDHQDIDRLEWTSELADAIIKEDQETP